jgi:two-component system nitrogen regulation response regulator GlnG
MEGRPGADDFERLVIGALPSLVRDTDAEGRLYRTILARVERPLLRHALEMAEGNQLKAARLLGINRNTLRKRLRLLGLLPARDGNRAAASPPRSG